MCFHARFYFPSEVQNTAPEPQPQTPMNTSVEPAPLPQQIEEQRCQPVSGVVREVRLIHRLQQQNMMERLRGTNCGNCQKIGHPRPIYNTRPFILYLPNGEEYSIRITDPLATATRTFGTNNSNSIPSRTKRSSIFRVENVQGNTAVLRALKVVLNQYIATHACVTVNLNEFVGIQTLNDAYVANLYA